MVDITDDLKRFMVSVKETDASALAKLENYVNTSKSVPPILNELRDDLDLLLVNANLFEMNNKDFPGACDGRSAWKIVFLLVSRVLIAVKILLSRLPTIPGYESANRRVIRKLQCRQVMPALKEQIERIKTILKAMNMMRLVSFHPELIQSDDIQTKLAGLWLEPFWWSYDPHVARFRDMLSLAKAAVGKTYKENNILTKYFFQATHAVSLFFKSNRSLVKEGHDVGSQAASVEYLKAYWDMAETGLPQLVISLVKPWIKVSESFVLRAPGNSPNHSPSTWDSVTVLINYNHALPFAIPKNMKAEKAPDELPNPAVSLTASGAMIPTPVSDAISVDADDEVLEGESPNGSPAPNAILGMQSTPPLGPGPGKVVPSYGDGLLMFEDSGLDKVPAQDSHPLCDSITNNLVLLADEEGSDSMLVNTRVNVVPGEPQDSLCADDLEVDKEEKSPTTTKPSVVSDETRRKSLDERASALGIDMSTKSVRPPQILRRQSRSDPIMAFDSGFVNGEPTDAVTSSQQLSSPRGKKVLPVLFHIHGGGFISGSPSTHEVYLREWAKATDAIIFAVDYTKAPEGKFPRALDECYHVYKWLLSENEFGLTPGRFVISGDSAGGNLALACIFKAVEDGLRLPDAMFLAYPAVDLTRTPTPSRVLFANDILLPYFFLEVCLDAYNNTAYDSKTNPLISPLYASDELLAKLPNEIIIMNAGYDPLLDDSVRFMQRLDKLKKRYKFLLYELPHGFLNFGAGIPKAQKAVRKSVECMKELFHVPPGKPASSSSSPSTSSTFGNILGSFPLSNPFSPSK